MPMKKLLFILQITFLLSVFATTEVKATHILGMNITYENIGGDTFVVYLDFYRYCGGTAFNNGNCTGAAGIGNTASYYLRCEDNSYQLNRIAYSDTIRDVSPICASLNQTQNSCIVGNCGLLGIQQGIYRDTIVMDSTLFGSVQCDNWIMVYASGARNTGVNYISQPSIVSYARLKTGNFPQNTSVNVDPNNPIPVFCEGQEVHYGWSGYDIDGDSLWWELDTAFNSYVNGVFSSINYSQIAGYDTFSAFDPLPGDVAINNHTGELTFTADIPPGYNYANYAVAVTISEYDQQSGLLKGEVHRDIQFFVTDSCNNLPPVSEATYSNLSGATLIDSVTIDVCSNDGFEFDIVIADYDSSGNLSVDSINTSCNIDQLIPNATWNATGTNPDTLHIVCPSYQTYYNPLMFTVSSVDNFCPINAVRTFSFFIKSTCTNYDSLNICLGQWQEFEYQNDSVVQLAVISGSPLTSQTYQCLNASCSEFELSPTAPTTYAATVWETGGLFIVDTFFVDVVTYLNATHTVTGAACLGSEVTLEVDVQNASIYDILWTDTANMIYVDTVDSATAGLTQAGTVGFIYSISTDSNCSTTDTIELIVHSLPNVTAGADPNVCAGQQFQLTVTGGASSYQWTPTTGLVSPSSDTTNGIIGQEQVYYVHGTDANGCVNFDSSTVFVTQNLLLGVAEDTTGLPVSSSTVYFIGVSAALDSVYLLDSTVTNANGEFSYNPVDSSFYVKVNPNFSTWPNLIPTYYDEKNSVQIADFMNTDFCDTVSYVHKVITGFNSGGIGFIAGLISQGAGRAGEPVAGLPVFALDSLDRIVGWEKTNQNGEFTFDDLTTGDYRIYVDKLGVENNLSPSISLTTENYMVDSLQFILYSNRLELAKPSSVEGVEKERIEIFPNPTTGQITVMGDALFTSIRIVDILGAVNGTFQVNSDQSSINLSDLPDGVYFVEVFNGQELIEQQRVVLMK